MKLLNGEIKAKSEVGKGTTFNINLPITLQATVRNTRLESPANISPPIPKASETIVYNASESNSTDGERPRLLIVEDNKDVVQFLVACLENDYQLQIAHNGQEGIDLAIEQVPDLIVSDVMMPVKDGFELCDTLKKDERTSHIPVILLTAKADLDSKISGLKRGADAYLTKPFEPEELLVRLEKLLELRKKLQERYSGLQFTQVADTSPSIEDEFLQKVKKGCL